MVEVYRKASGLVGIEFFFFCVCVSIGVGNCKRMAYVCGVEINLCREW